MQTQGDFEIAGWDEEPILEAENGAKSTRASVKRTFKGDFEGEGRTEYLMSYRADQTADFVGLERIEGRIGDKQGAVTLKLSGTFDGGVAKADWEVVEGSGQGDFTGASGKGSFEAPKGSHGGKYELDLKL